MCFLGEPFQHDLFVSYSHGDLDGSGNSNLRKWSQAFVRELETELRSDPKFRDLKLFLDQDHRPEQGVDPMEPLSDQLRADIAKAGVLTLLMSPHYLLSRWCGDEREWWAHGQRKHELETAGRIAVAHIWPTEDPWPSALTDSRGEPLVGFKFHDANRPQPFEWPDPTGAKGPFREELLRMVQVLWTRLRKLRDELEIRRKKAEEAAALKAATGQLIYLHGRIDHADAWRSTCHLLKKQELVVLPTGPDPVEKDNVRARQIAESRVQILSGCHGLLLLGTDDGWALDADLVVVGNQDRQLARARSGRILPCAVLNTGGREIATADRIGVAEALGIDWIDAANEQWSSEVTDWLGRAGEQAQTA